MPFIPLTEADEQEMLSALGVAHRDDLFDEIPPHLRSGHITAVPEAEPEMDLMRQMQGRARQDEVRVSFLGAGAYDHHIPAAVWDLVTRGEFMTAYTPYQAEASQGTLQLIYEYQSMMSSLTGMDVANASVYDGASALAESILMAVRANRRSKSRRVLCAGNVHPLYLSACRSIVSPQGITISELPFDQDTGLLDQQALSGMAGEDFAALVIASPNFFGGLEQVDVLTDWAHEQGGLVIGVINPLSLGLLKPPGEWGAEGADIVAGEGQPLGIPVASGGPYLGIMCCKQDIVRQMPGRIIGRTTDLEDREGFTLTLQAREQHIRRAKATSNICTNQGLLVTAATIYMSLLGPDGLRSVALQCHQGMNTLKARLAELPGVSLPFVKAGTPHFHEVVVRVPGSADEIADTLAQQGVLAGLPLGRWFPALQDCLLVNVTEKHTEEDLELLISSLSRALGGNS